MYREPLPKIQSCLNVASCRLVAICTTFVVFAVHSVCARVGDDIVDVEACGMCRIGKISPGESVTSTLKRSDCLRENQFPLQFYEFELTREFEVRFDLHSSDFDAVFVLMDDECEFSSGNDDCPLDDTRDSCLWRRLEPGLYYVGVSSFGNQEVGEYTLSVDYYDPLDCVVGRAGCEVPIAGELTPAACRTANNDAIELWEFEVPHETEVTLTLLEWGDNSPGLQVFDDLGTRVVANFSCLTSSCIQETLSAGTYYLGVQASVRDNTEPYLVTLECPDLLLCRDCNRGAVGCDSEVKGALTEASCRTTGGPRVDFWTFDVSAREVVDVEVRSNGFDPVLEIFDGDLRLVAANDDCVEQGLQSCVLQELEAGEYCIGVGGFFNDAVGEYALKIRCRNRSAEVVGDCNADGRLEISDGSCLLGYLFKSRPTRLPCGDGSEGHPDNRLVFDVNRDRAIDISDGILVLAYLFLGREVPALSGGCVETISCPGECSE